MHCPAGINILDICIFLFFYLCSVFLQPGMDFVRKIPAMFIIFLGPIIIKYMVSLNFWKNKIINDSFSLLTVAVQECQARKIILKKNTFTSINYEGKKEGWYFHQHDKTFLNLGIETLFETWRYYKKLWIYKVFF